MTKFSPIVSEFESAEQEVSCLRWMEAKVAASLADPRPPVPRDQVMVEIDRIIAEKSAKSA